jgi:hypothetical protein
MARAELVWSDAPLKKKRRAKILFLGPPKVGKTVTVVGTAPGRKYVINCDQPDSLDHVREFYPNALFAQDPEPIHDMGSMDSALFRARKMAKAGEIETVILDTLSGFSQFLIEECKELNPDGRKYYPAYTNYIVNLCARVIDIPCHVIVTSHFIDASSEDAAEGGKVGPGIVPLLETKAARLRVGGMFNDVVFYEKRKAGRVFVTDIEGVWGPGCRSIHRQRLTPMKANVRTLLREMGILPPRTSKTNGSADE